MIKEKILSRIPSKSTIKDVANCMESEINIYNQAHITRESSPILINSLPQKSNKEIAITFLLEGELKGQVVCLINLEQSQINHQNALSMQSLLSESMNILLGRFLTNLEEETGLMSMLTDPKIVATMDDLPNSFKIRKYKDINVSTRYKLITATDKFDCLVIIQADKTAVREV
jgi:chemotaxis protein CheY-P-specific phosphatase CheC